MRFKPSPEDKTDPADGLRLGSGARRAPQIKPLMSKGIGLNSVPEWLREAAGSTLAQNMIDQTRMQPPVPMSKPRLPALTGNVLGTAQSGRPIVENEDGSVSTERSITVTHPWLNGGAPTNIPSMWNGVELDEDQAVEAALATGQQWQAYRSIDEAVAAARARSEMLGGEMQQMGIGLGR